MLQYGILEAIGSSRMVFWRPSEALVGSARWGALGELSGSSWSAFRPFAVSHGLRFLQFSTPEACLDHRTAKRLNLVTLSMKLLSF